MKKSYDFNAYLEYRKYGSIRVSIRIILKLLKKVSLVEFEAINLHVYRL